MANSRTQARYAHRLTSVVATLLAGLLSLTLLTGLPSAPSWALGSMLCTPGRIYGVASGSLLDISTSTGAATTLDTFDSAVNALAINASGTYAYGVQTGATATFTIQRVNPVTGVVNTYVGATAFTSGDTAIAGAVNPANGIYYYAAIGNTTSGNIYAFDTTTNTSIGRVGSIALPQGLNNGDILFDAAGNMYVTLAPGSNTDLYFIGQVATTAGSTSYAPVWLGTYAGVVANGVAFDADGFIYLSSSSGVTKFNPVTMVVVASYPMSGLVDLADCNYPGTIEVKKDIVSRIGSQQFGLSLTSGGAALTNGTGATVGTDTGLQNTNPETAGLVFGVPGTSYEFAESVSPGLLGSYTTTYQCVNSLTGVTISGGTATSGSLTFPSTVTNGSLAAVVCTFRNTPRQTITVTKALTSPRINAGDQFRVQIRDTSGGVLSSATNATTTGSGSTVTPGSGTTGEFSAAAATDYVITEVAAGATTLSNYVAFITCTDAAGLQTGLPNAQPLGTGWTLRPIPGALISCTISNRQPGISVTKQVGTRYYAADQFTVAISGPGVSQSATTSGTSTSASTPNTSFQAGATYTITDTMAAGSTAALSDYTATLACLNTTTGAALTTTPAGAGRWTVVPSAGQDVACTVTNTVRSATITVQKALSSNGRGNDSQQFTVQLLANGTLVPPTGSETTTGAGTTVTPGTGTTGAVTATPGVTYSVDEVLPGSGNWTPSLTCVDLTGRQLTGLPVNATWTPGSAPRPSFTPLPGADIYCTLTNIRGGNNSRSVTVEKFLAGPRFAAGDQFTVSLASGTSTTSSTSTGTGSTITPGTGTTGAQVVNTNTTYTISEAAAGTTNLANYVSTISCTNTATGSTTTLPSGTLPPGGVTLTPQGLDRIHCRITNSPKPTITVAKRITSRFSSADQFTVTLRTGGVTGATQVSATTSGAPLTATSAAFVATAGTTYTVTETAGGGGSLTNYAKSIVCTDSTGLTSGLPNGPFDPATGASVIPAVGAKITCEVTNTPNRASLTVTKQITGGGRINAGDQFTVQIKQGTTVVSSATTAGTGSTVNPGSGTTGAYLATPGTTYTISETASGGTDLTKYTKTVSCTDANGIQTTGLPTAIDTNFTLLAGAAVTCTLTNASPPAPTLRVTKELAGAGRLNAADQFTVQIRQGTSVVSSTTNATTAGTGSSVTAGTGTTGTFTAAAATSYTISEVMAAGSVTPLSRYAGSLSCTDSNAVQTTGLPTSLNSAFTLQAGAAVSCVLTNTSVASPTLVVTKQLAGAGRVAAADQFTVSIKQGATVVSSTTTATTTGSGTTVDAGTGTTGTYTADPALTYTVSEAMAPGSSSALSRYTTSVSCTDLNGIQASGLPTAIDSGFTLLGGAAVSCVITNTTAQPTITLTKQIAGGGRVTATDQFTVQILDGTSVVSSTTDAPTAGAGITVSPGTGTTGVFTGTAGTTYTLTEVGDQSTDLTAYTATITCSDASGLTTPLPSAAALPAGGYPLTPGPLAEISCTITNTSTQPVVHVSKQSSGCDISVTSCPLGGATFALFDTDPTVGTPTPIPGGITVDSTNGPTFTSTGLLYGTDYWLVETRAPNGFNLLAAPVKFSVSGAGVALSTAAPNGSALITLAGTPPNTIVIQDTPTGALPVAGGRGPGWTFLLAALLMLAAGFVFRRGRPAVEEVA